ncbi:DUF4145 domain-containing protein [Leptolyngbya ohadii]|uniref:DUF4145 domain-containing protein n=1 Tax=Leptolyngbya ohadii TaxID=1962290 RepID=UPI000B5A1FB0|nr:DUF4145 domain-containing protein [Leptolyngbya ohadii]
MNEVEFFQEVCNCGGTLKCQTTFSYPWRDNEENSFYLLHVFKILTCVTCNEATVLLYTTLGDDDADEQWAETEHEEPQYRSYKRKVLYSPTTQLHHSIPPSIAEVFNQAEAVLPRSTRACFILCRAVLEEICNDFGIPAEGINNKGKTHPIRLGERLPQLFEKEQLAEDLKPIMNGIKDFGNEGAHPNDPIFNKQVESEDAEILLELVSFVLERLYVDKYRKQKSMEKLNTLRQKIPPRERRE